MFRGEQEYNLDDKGRILIPARFRPELGDVVMLSRGGDGQINIYPKAFFEAMEQRVRTSGNTASFRLTDRFLAAAIECEVDRQGRLVIPPVLRKHARLANEVIIVGNRDRIEVWNPDLWQQVYEQWVADFRANQDDYAKIVEAGLQI